MLNRRAFLASALTTAAAGFVARGRLLRAQISPSRPSPALPPIVSDELFHGVPVAFPPPPDGVHCTQACVYSAVISLYQQEVLDYADIDTLTSFHSGRGTWSCAAVLCLDRYVPNVHLTSNLDYGAAADSSVLPDDVLPMAVQLASTRADLYTYAPATPPSAVLDHVNDSLVLAHVNARTLSQRAGSSIGHAVLVDGNDGDILHIVDPDDPRRYRMISMDEFSRAFLREMILIPRNHLTAGVASSG